MTLILVYKSAKWEGEMASFKLLFRIYCDDCERENPTLLVRVIDVPGKIWADRVARAMLGEVVAVEERIWTVLSVEKTDEPPNMGSWDADISWRQPVFEFLFDRRDLGIEPIYATKPTGKRELAGFSFRQSTSALI